MTGWPRWSVVDARILLTNLEGLTALQVQALWKRPHRCRLQQRRPAFQTQISLTKGIDWLPQRQAGLKVLTCGDRDTVMITECILGCSRHPCKRHL